MGKNYNYEKRASATINKELAESLSSQPASRGGILHDNGLHADAMIGAARSGEAIIDAKNFIYVTKDNINDINAGTSLSIDKEKAPFYLVSDGLSSDGSGTYSIYNTKEIESANKMHFKRDKGEGDSLYKRLLEASNEYESELTIKKKKNGDKAEAHAYGLEVSGTLFGGTLGVAGFKAGRAIANFFLPKHDGPSEDKNDKLTSNAPTDKQELNRIVYGNSIRSNSLLDTAKRMSEIEKRNPHIEEKVPYGTPEFKDKILDINMNGASGDNDTYILLKDRFERDSKYIGKGALDANDLFKKITKSGEMTEELERDTLSKTTESISSLDKVLDISKEKDNNSLNLAIVQERLFEANIKDQQMKREEMRLSELRAEVLREEERKRQEMGGNMNNTTAPSLKMKN